MDSQNSTESLLLRSLSSNEYDETVESVSTDALINENIFSSSTGSLLHENVQALLDRLHIPETSYVESESSGNTVLSSSSVSASGLFRNDSKGSEKPANISTREDHNVVDPILSILYNKVQVFLLRNSLSLEFLKIYKRYVSYLVESGLNPLEDRYFLILQNELSESYNFTPAIEKVLNAFLVRPESLIMKLALFEHKRMYHLLKLQFESWRLRFTMRGGLRKFEHVWQEYLRRKYFLLWKRKLELIKNEIFTQAEKFNQFTLVSSTFDTWLARVDAEDAKKKLADHYFMDHFLQCLKKRMKYICSADLQAQQRYDKKCQEKWLLQWALRSREHNFVIRNTNLKRYAFLKLRSKFISYEELRHRAKFTKRILQTATYFDIWRTRKDETHQRSQSLVAVEERFIKKKTLSFLKMAFKQREQEMVVVRRLDTLLLTFMFKKVWLIRFREQIHYYSLCQIRNERIAVKYLLCWKKLLFSHIEAYEFERKRRLVRCMKEWRLQMQCQKYLSLRKENTIKSLFSMWFEGSVREVKLGQFQSKTLVRIYYHTWERKFEVSQDKMQQAINLEGQVLMKDTLAKWFGHLKIITDMEERSLILMKLHAISLLKRGIAHMRDVQRFSEICDPLIFSKSTLSKFLLLWRNNATLRRRQKLDIVSADNKKLLQERLITSAFHLWIERSRFYQIECASNADKMHDRNLHRHFFVVVNEKLKYWQALLALGENLRSKSLLLSYLCVWKYRISYIQDLGAKLETEMNRKNLALLLNYLNAWSMRILKSRRNDETVQIFRRRWDRAVVRGLLLLWKNRADHSPKKLRAGRSHQKPIGTELVTPVRQNASKINTIPGSEGVKQYRMEAMKSHYSRVRRVIPSPIKSSATLSTIAKRKINQENATVSWSPKPLPPPRLSLEKINKNIASRIDKINFERIPEVRLDQFMDSDSDSRADPRIDRSLLEVGEEIEFDESPTRRV